MSMFSGKCDFYDHLWVSAKTEEEAFNKFNGTKLYIRQPLPKGVDFTKELKNGINIPDTYYKKVEYNSIKDLIPYYPHLISMACCGNTDSHNSIVFLSCESFVDEEERDTLEFYLKNLLRVYMRCKRKKIEFNVEEAVNEVCWSGYNKEQITEIANRVKESGKKANTNGIRLPFYEEFYRKTLVDEMIKHGINPCEYGDYERFVKKV